jgi:hypothetical protein
MPKEIKELAGAFLLLAPAALVAGGSLLFFVGQLSLISLSVPKATGALGVLTLSIKGVATFALGFAKAVLIIALAVETLSRLVFGFGALVAKIRQFAFQIRGFFTGKPDKAQINFWREMNLELGKLAIGESQLLKLLKTTKNFYAEAFTIPEADLDGITKKMQTTLEKIIGKSVGGGVKSGLKGLQKSTFGVGEFLPTFGSLTGGGIFSRSLKQNNIVIQIDSESKFGQEVMSFIASQGALAQ